MWSESCILKFHNANLTTILPNIEHIFFKPITQLSPLHIQPWLYSKFSLWLFSAFACMIRMCMLQIEIGQTDMQIWWLDFTGTFPQQNRTYTYRSLWIQMGHCCWNEIRPDGTCLPNRSATNYVAPAAMRIVPFEWFQTPLPAVFNNNATCSKSQLCVTQKEVIN